MPSLEISPMQDLSRREALTLAAAACACACAGGADEKPDNKPMPKSLAIGKLADFDKEGFYDFRDSKVMVSRLEDRLVVMSAVCTHKRCMLKIEEDKKSLKCNCHKSFFSEQGTVTGGPAKSSLVRYAVSQKEDGTITADLTQSFSEKQWEDAKSFVPVKAK
jgi:Rieske Fe-S protein